jgi:SAM-dependent methyltransferase
MPNSKESALSAIQEQTIQRYSDRFRLHGHSPLSLGWGNLEQQRLRFEVALSCMDFSGRSILDYGCGLGDFNGYIKEHKIDIASYTGIDLNPEFIKEASKRFPNDVFHVNNIKADQQAWKSDIVVMLGVMNFRQSAMDNLSYARQLIHRTFDLSRVALICDFMTTMHPSEIKEDDWIHYYQPEEALALGLEISRKVILKHDYPPIPQQEMMLVIQR